MKAAIDALDMTAAKINKDALDSIVGARAAAVRPEVDRTLILAQRIVNLQTAASRLIGTAGDEIDMERLNDLIMGLPSEDAQVDKLAVVKSGTKAPGASLQDAFDFIAQDIEVGTFMTVAQITKLGNLVSGGAVAACLFPQSGNCTLVGWEPVDATSTAPRGAVYVG